MGLTGAATAHDTTYSLNKPDANAQAGSDAGDDGYYAILPDTEVRGLDGARMVIWFERVAGLPSKGVLDDDALKAVCEARMPFVATLPATPGTSPDDRLFGVGANRDRDDGSNKADRALLAVWRVGDGCALD